MESEHGVGALYIETLEKTDDLPRLQWHGDLMRSKCYVTFVLIIILRRCFLLVA